MGIFVQVEDRDGEARSKTEELQRLPRHFPSIEGSACLGCVSAEEDAKFNRGQALVLSRELEGLEAKGLKKEEQDELKILQGLCRKVQEGSKLYLCFYGESD